MPRSRSCSSRTSSSDRSDRDIVEGIRRGEEKDFNLLYDRYFQRVYSYAYVRLRHRADAEEVAQETFAAVFRCIDAYRGQSSLLSWVYGIAKNTVNNQVRRARAYEARLERAEPDLQRSSRNLSHCTPEENLGLQRCTEAIQERLASLADWHAEVFLMRHAENLPISEIARRMSRSNDAIRSSLYRVKRLLVEAVDPELAGA